MRLRASWAQVDASFRDIALHTGWSYSVFRGKVRSDMGYH